MRKQRGFTLVELMVVVAILGICAAFVVKNFKRRAVGNEARRVANMMATAYRTAVSAGPVRADVSAANAGLKARAQMTFANNAQGSRVTVWRLVEDPSPQTTFQWIPIQSVVLDDAVTVWRVADTANINLATSTITQGGLPATKNYFPDASADSFTIYLRETKDANNRYRVVGMPLSPAPQVFQDW